MTNYQQRLERLEAAVAPDDRLIVLAVKDGQTNEEALAQYARAHGVKPADVRGTGIYITAIDGLL